MKAVRIGDLNIAVDCPDGLIGFELDGNDCELSLSEQRHLLAALLRNLIAHRDALGGCPLAGIPEINPCPLCDPAVRP